MRRLENLLVSEEAFAKQWCRQWQCEERATHYVFLKERAIAAYCNDHAQRWLDEGYADKIMARKRFDSACAKADRHGVLL